MAKVEGVDALVTQLRAKAKKSADENDVYVVVGYSAAYAIYVHENLQAHHEVGQAKYLEEPARTLVPVLKGIIRDAMKRGLKLAQALIMAGLRLQRESQQLCPVDTGNLRASAFTRLVTKGGGGRKEAA